MPDRDPVLRQRSALAEFALVALGASDSIAVAEGALDALQTGLDLDHAALFERRSFGLDLVVCAGWPTPESPTDDPPASALRALGLAGPLVFDDGPTRGLAVQIDTDPVRLLIGATKARPALDDTARAFATDVAAILRGGLLCTATARALRASEDHARTSEAHAHAILNTTVDGIITIDTQGLIQSFNPAAEAIFGYRAAEVIGQNVSILMPEGYAAHHDDHVQTYVSTGHRRVIGTGREVLGKRRDGSTFPMDLAVSEVVVPGLRLFTGIVRDITERRQLEREVVRAIEDERRILGQELHDELGQQLSGIRLLSQNLARRIADAALADEVQEIADLIRQADNKARSLSRGLVLVDVSDQDLDASLAQMTARAARLFDTPARYTASGTPRALADLTTTHVYRIAQEAFTNAARHARPRKIHVHLDWLEHGVRLVVTDDGVGISGLDTASTADSETRRGMGLKTMTYRARLIGGTLTLAPGPDGGTRVTCTVPHEYAAPVDLALDIDALGDA